MSKEVNRCQTPNTAATASEPRPRRLLWPHCAWLSPLIGLGVFVCIMSVLCGLLNWKEYQGFAVAGSVMAVGILVGIGFSCSILISTARTRWSGIVCLVVGVLVNGLLAVSMLQAAWMNWNLSQEETWLKEKHRRERAMTESFIESMHQLKDEGVFETDESIRLPTNEAEERPTSTPEKEEG